MDELLKKKFKEVKARNKPYSLDNLEDK